MEKDSVKRLAILGSTGSIGRNTLEVVRSAPDSFRVLSLTGGRNVDLLEAQIREFAPSIVALSSEEAAFELRKRIGMGTEILSGVEGLIAAATVEGVDMVVAAISGAAGLLPTLAAIRAGKDVAIANKESLVIAGPILMKEVKRRGSRLIPIDSEHSAVFQALQGNRMEDVKRIILTASGGPFLRFSIEEMERVTPEDALNHPKWDMGRRITVDSATLMNKGLEIIEARWLFGIEPERISVLIHPESIIHSMVEYVDRSVIAQMAYPDMKIPISYALSYPRRMDLKVSCLNFSRIGELTFEEPDRRRFPCLDLAYQALREGGTMPAVLNGADEVAVEAFLNRRIPFTTIPKVIEETMEDHKTSYRFDVKDLLEVDRWARERAWAIVKGIGD